MSKSRATIRFLVSFDGIVDLLTIIPAFFLSGFVIFRMLRVARVFHLFRLNAKYDSFNVITTVLYEKRNQIISSVFIVLILMLASSLCMYSVEHDAQPEVFRNAFSGIWWSMSTLLTVGYGDIYPITTLATCASAKRHDFEIEWYYYYTWGKWLNIRGSNDSCFVTKRHRKGCIPLNCTLHIFWKFGLTTTLFWYSINRRKWVFQPYSFYSCGSLVSFFILKISYKYNLLSWACLITILPLKILYPVNSPSLLYLGTANLVS